MRISTLLTIIVIVLGTISSAKPLKKPKKKINVLNVDANDLSKKELKNHYSLFLNYLQNYAKRVRKEYYPLCKDQNYLEIKNKDSKEYKNFAIYFSTKVKDKYTYNYGIERQNPVNTINFLYEISGKNTNWLIFCIFCTFMFVWCFIENFITKCRVLDMCGCLENKKTKKARRYGMAIISIVIGIFTIIYCSASLNKSVASVSKKTECSFKWSIFN